MEIKDILYAMGMDFARCVDVTELTPEENQGLPRAVIFGKALSKQYIRDINNNSGPDRVAGDGDEFDLKESECERLADWLASHIRTLGYTAFPDSLANLESLEKYNSDAKLSPLPHKTVARLAGLGFIGKNTLLVTEDYGCAVSMCTVLTDMPLETENVPVPPAPACGDCEVCRDVCPKGVLAGRDWGEDVPRDERLDAIGCVECIRCLTMCPYTLKYADS